jgi:hypothetical protein
MNPENLKDIIDSRSLSTEERMALLAELGPELGDEYAAMIDRLSTVDVPSPSSARRLQGRSQLLNAVDRYHERSRGARLALRWAPAIPFAGIAGLLLTASAAASYVADVELPGRPVAEVLSALGIEKDSQQTDPQGSEDSIGSPPQSIPDPTPDSQDVAGPAPTVETESQDDTEGQDPDATSPGQENPGKSDPPGHGGENPGQGVDPPGHGGENPGQGAEPPGQGGENPGQGADPPGHGGENPGQGTEPPGQSAEPPGQGGENPGQGEAGQGQGGGGQQDPPGQGEQSSGEGGNGQGQGNRP